MILQLAPDAPLILRLAAGSALVLHVGGGLTGIASGFIAILAKKGEWLHRTAGKVFFGAMLTMTGVAAIVAPMLPSEQWTNTMAAVFTFYLVATSWATVRRPEGETGAFERIALIAPLGLVGAGLVLAVTDLGGPRDGAFNVIYAFSGLAALAGACDLLMIRAGGIGGTARIARHLWRMTLALFVATGSFFLGQPRFVPQIFKDTGLNIALPVSVVVLLVFWMVRVRMIRVRQPLAAVS